MSSEGSRGWLHKRGGADAKGGWRKRWCVFVNQAFHYFKTDADKEPTGTIYAEDIIQVVANKEESVKDNKFPFVFDIQTEERIYLFCATSSKERDTWIKLLSRATTEARGITLQRGVINMEKLEYATIEAFCDKGLRVNGNVSQDLLSTFSQGVTTKQKKADERGWYCDVHVPAATLLTLMAQHNWSLLNAFNTKSTSLQGTTLVPSTMYVFTRPTDSTQMPSLSNMSDDAMRRPTAATPPK
ncbi:uncharacterized protein LOC134194726 isoform X2 [Corticium candelabrum]|uniref:uncharacterized protein LOC134194726 isoform X2 n=1 Tax=Corticium candelabrum TaxID=121492 RepID=UPI002E254DBF|nr:uncharacterized protein LOC134194726 isoform X2 [Corticium candelabrum]